MSDAQRLWSVPAQAPRDTLPSAPGIGAVQAQYSGAEHDCAFACEAARRILH